MNTKRFFAAIFAAAILSISFLACDPKEDDPTTNPTPSTDVVKEVYGFFGKSEAQVLPLLDAKGWAKVSDSSDLGVVYTYISADSLKMYAVYSIDNTIKGAAYGVAENTSFITSKLASNVDKFFLLFENWEQSLSTCSILNSVYQGAVGADDFQFQHSYDDRAEFLNVYQTKKPTLNFAASMYESPQTLGSVNLFIDYEGDESTINVIFEDEILSSEKSKTTKNSWFRR